MFLLTPENITRTHKVLRKCCIFWISCPWLSEGEHSEWHVWEIRRE